jgi:hypothetical protein
MPVAIRRGSLVPDATIAWNVMIMPMTVPMRPNNGPAATASRRNDWKRSSFGTSRSTASEIRSSASSALSLLRLPSPRYAINTRPSGLLSFGLSRFFSCDATAKRCRTR